MNKIFCRVAPSLGALEDTPENIWGTPPYDPEKHTNEPCIFFGLYGLPDFYALWRHKGKKYILWAGSDIRHLENNYWLNTEGEIRLGKKGICEWIQHYCESWVENEVEYKALFEIGINSRICPSFLGDITKFKVSYQWSKRPKLYTSVSGDDFKLYGWDKIDVLSIQHPDIEFHLYGNSEKFSLAQKNVFVHGRVPKKQMNKEIKDMQGALRLVEFDGASEIIVKAMLMGQYAFSLIEYPFVDTVYNLNMLATRREANILGRVWWIRNLNKFPWNKYARN